MNQSNFVVELSEKDFNNRQPILKNYKDKLVLIKFYTNWCGYCVRSIPDYEELSRKYKNNKRVVIAQMDAEKNNEFLEHLNKFNNWEGVNGYPTILLFKNNLYLTKYTGNRTVVDYIDFLNKYY
jgi:protein disulfide-isomerase A6